MLLQLLLRYGPSVLSRLNGMFAFAFVDLTKRTFLLARDRLGVKPLYWYNRGGKLRFASEPKGLLVGRTPPERSIGRPFWSSSHLVISRPIHASWKGYGKLDAGTYAAGSLDPPSLNPTRYWSIHMSPGSSSDPLTHGPVPRVPRALTDAVKIRLRRRRARCTSCPGESIAGSLDRFAAEFSAPPLALTVGFAWESCRDETSIARGKQRRILD